MLPEVPVAPVARSIRRAGRPADRVFSLEEAVEALGQLRGVEPSRLMAVVLRLGPLLFFRGARRNGDGSWRVPEADVRALLGGPLVKALSVQEFAEGLGISRWSVQRAVNAGVIRKLPALPRPLPQVVRIAMGEFLRCFEGGLGSGDGRKRKGVAA